MKTLEERLRNNAVTMYSFLDGRDRFVRLDDALAIVADAQKELTLADGSISSAPGTISFGSENLQSYKECEVCGGKRYWVNTLDAFVPCTFCDSTNSPSQGKG